MKILMLSYAYAPSVGGIETTSRLLAEEWRRSGHEVMIVTETAASPPLSAPTDPLWVVRQPGAMSLWRWMRWADVIFQNNVSLRLARTLPLVNRPWVVTTQTWLDHGGRLGGAIKRLALRFARRIYISEAIANDVGLRGSTIPNPYDTTVFDPRDGVRDGDLVVVARLVSDKGVDLLLEALASLRRDHDLRPRLTIVGSGPEEQALKHLTEMLGLTEQVTFCGPQNGKNLADCLRRHRVLVVPSRWAEPFGIVAVEGIACGCFVVGSKAGGLGEAIGECGITFENGNVSALVNALKRALTDSQKVKSAKKSAPSHLQKFQPKNIAAQYVAIFQSAVTK